MQITLFKPVCLSVSMFILSGCLATTDLLTDGKLSPTHLKFAQEIADKTIVTCVTVKYRGSDETPSNQMKFSERPEIKSLWSSDSGWFKANLLVDQTWDYVYYNSSNGKLICGQKNWDSYSEARTIQFTRVDVKEKSINDIISKPTQQPLKSESVENRLSAAKSLFDKKLITSEQYDQQVKRILEDQ